MADGTPGSSEKEARYQKTAPPSLAGHVRARDGLKESPSREHLRRRSLYFISPEPSRFRQLRAYEVETRSRGRNKTVVAYEHLKAGKPVTAT